MTGSKAIIKTIPIEYPRNFRPFLSPSKKASTFFSTAITVALTAVTTSFHGWAITVHLHLQRVLLYIPVPLPAGDIFHFRI